MLIEVNRSVPALFIIDDVPVINVDVETGGERNSVDLMEDDDADILIRFKLFRDECCVERSCRILSSSDMSLLFSIKTDHIKYK
jgi:hypothetical protein